MAPSLESVYLNSKQILYEPKEPTKYVYFPENAVISIASRMQDGRTIEAGMVGYEGVVGIHTLFGVSSAPYQYLTLIGGDAYRIKAGVFKAELKRKGILYDMLLRYTQARLIQFSHIGACNCLHPTIERVCRWLLMVHDRAMSNELSLTQDAISRVLRVRRTGITEAVGILQKKRLISYGYGKITILAHKGLERAACECYRTIKDEFTELLKR